MAILLTDMDTAIPRMDIATGTHRTDMDMVRFGVILSELASTS